MNTTIKIALTTVPISQASAMGDGSGEAFGGWQIRAPRGPLVLDAHIGAKRVMIHPDGEDGVGT